MSKKRIAVVNRTNFKNYGSVLQCFALCEAIRLLGYDSEIIWAKGGISKNYDIRINKAIYSLYMLVKNPNLIPRFLRNLRSVNTTPISDTTIKLFDEFVEEYIKQKSYSINELKRIVKKGYYIKYVCGSDQIWNPHSLYLDPMLFLQFAPKDDRIAYAPSLGSNDIPKYNRKKLKKYVNSIPCVSVREKKGRELLYRLCKKMYPVVLDPTLLHTKEYWNKFICLKETNPYILCYFLNAPNIDIQKNIQKYAKKNNMKIIELNFRMKKYIDGVNIYHKDCGPAEFISYVSDSKIVFTDSYHGMLFSLIFNREFYSIARNYEETDQSSRQISILSILDLTDRYIKNWDDFIEKPIDYELINHKILQLRDDSLKYLQDSINGRINNGDS